MSLDIPDGETAFVDANILHYAVIATPPFSEHVYPFIDRIDSGLLTGIVSVQALADAQHKTMLSLLATQYRLPRSKLVRWVKDHPAELRALTGFTRSCSFTSYSEDPDYSTG
jgi:predicted nucleic acid-binding protein